MILLSNSVRSHAVPEDAGGQRGRRQTENRYTLAPVQHRRVAQGERLEHITVHEGSVWTTRVRSMLYHRHHHHQHTHHNHLQ